MYVLPSRRKAEAEKQKPQSKPSEMVCKWCHESGHLSIHCNFKGKVLPKKPQLDSVEDFPSLVEDSRINDVQKDLKVTWHTPINIDTLRNIATSQPDKKITRINSSVASLDTLTSCYSEHDSRLEDMISIPSIDKVHPYKAYYDIKQPTDLLKLTDDLDFRISWYRQEHCLLKEDVRQQESAWEPEH